MSSTVYSTKPPAGSVLTTDLTSCVDDTCTYTSECVTTDMDICANTNDSTEPAIKDVPLKTPIVDSGVRRQFDSGAVRDVQVGKGRCDLMPLSVLADILKVRTSCNVYVPALLMKLSNFLFTKDESALLDVINSFIDGEWGGNAANAFLDLSIHFEQGADKYGEHNWEKGIPLHSYIDSGVRHLLKVERGDSDENHKRAFLWNMVCGLWTLRYRKDDCDDLVDYNWSEDNNSES